MKEGPNIALLGSLIGDPARANMLTALLSGKALTASELAFEAGITLQTASSHLAKMEAGFLLQRRKQGRHRYFTLANDDVVSVLETMMGFAEKHGHTRTRTGPKDPALRRARVCYNHLAGELSIQMFDSLSARKLIIEEGERMELTNAGQTFMSDFGIDLEPLTKLRRPLCKPCLDWSARRSHLAGALGTALLNRFYDLKWAKRISDSRIIDFSKSGDKQFLEAFPI